MSPSMRPTWRGRGTGIEGKDWGVRQEGGGGNKVGGRIGYIELVMIDHSRQDALLSPDSVSRPPRTSPIGPSPFPPTICFLATAQGSDT